MKPLIISILTIGIIFIKIVWIRTEIDFSRERVNFQMFKTNGIEALIIILQILAAIYTPLPKSVFTSLLMLIGIGMYVLGFILAFWGRYTMKQSWGVPGEHADKQNHLVTKGPFAFSRNPIYLGFLLLYFGYAAAILSWLIILRIPLAIYFFNSAKKEEINLEKKFGKAYSEYKKKVPLFFKI